MTQANVRANHVALRIPSSKLPPSHHQSTRRGDTDARNSVLNSCPKQSRIVSRIACDFVDYCGCLPIFMRTVGRTLFACFVAASGSFVIGAGFLRHMVTGHTVGRCSTPLPRVYLCSADRYLLFSVISMFPSTSTPYGPSRGGCWPIMSEEVFSIRKEGEEPNRGETNVQCSKSTTSELVSN